jgi:2-aminoadipate transaminase
MLAALKREMPAGVEWNSPSGGMFLWVRLPQGMDAVTLLPKAVDKGVAFVPGAPFFAANPQARSLRLSFVTASVAEIDTGIAALASCIRENLP